MDIILATFAAGTSIFSSGDAESLSSNRWRCLSISLRILHGAVRRIHRSQFPRASGEHYNPIPIRRASRRQFVLGAICEQGDISMDWRYVRLDSEKLHFLRLKKNWNLDQLCDAAARRGRDPLTGKPLGLDKRTVKSIFGGTKTFVSKARVLADVLGAESVLAVLHPDELRQLRPPSSWERPLEFFQSVGEWNLVEPIQNEQSTSNGLRYDIWHVRHRHVANRAGRAKCYDLSQLSSNDRTRLKTHLTRHSEVCDRIGAHPNIARNLSAAEWEYGALWWVIDECRYCPSRS